MDSSGQRLMRLWLMWMVVEAVATLTGFVMLFTIDGFQRALGHLLLIGIPSTSIHSLPPLYCASHYCVSWQ
jgi:hypothetical protein